MDAKIVGERLKAIFKAKGLRQRELSAQTGIKQSSISEMINGKRNIMPLVEKVCELYGYSRDYIITGEEISRSDITAKNNIDDKGLSTEERVRLLDKLNELYEKHQNIISELQGIMKEITTINKLLIL